MNNIELMDAMRDCVRHMRALPDGGAGQPRLLGILLDKGDMTQKELQDAAGVRSATISETLAKLEAAGMVTRKISENDRRTVIVSLTEKGMIAANDVEDARAERAEELFGCFDDAERAQFGAHIVKLGEYWRGKFGNEGYRERHGRGGGFHEGKPRGRFILLGKQAADHSHDERPFDERQRPDHHRDGERPFDERQRFEHRNGGRRDDERQRAEHHHGGYRDGVNPVGERHRGKYHDDGHRA